MTQETIDAETGEITTVPPTDLAKVNLAEVALSRFGSWREGAVALVMKYKDVVFDCTTTKGMQEATAARMEVRAPRYAAQKVAKASKSELAAVSKAVGEEEAAIIKFLADTEEHIDKQIRAEEERKAQAKAEAERLAAEAAAAEVARIKRHREAVDVIHQYPIHAVGLPAERIEKGVKALQEMVFGEAQEECLPDYQAARDAALAKMMTMLDETRRAEAEAARVKAQLADLERREKALAEAERELRKREADELAAQRAEAARLEALAAADLQRAQFAEQEQVRAELAARAAPPIEPVLTISDAQAGALIASTLNASALTISADEPATLKLGEINARLHPLKLDAAGLAELGITPARSEGAAKLFRESDFDRVLRAIAKHIEQLQVTA